MIKNHYETTGSVAYLVRKEIPGFEAFGGVVLNFNQGGLNSAIVEYLANGIKGHPGRIVWMPTYDSENAVKRSNQASRPFVAVVKNGQVVPELKEVLRLIAKYDLTLATGHLSPEQGLQVLQEARKQGVRHMIMTHPMDAGVFATEAQMKEAAKLGAFLEFDFRNILTGKIEYPFKTAPVSGGRVEMIRTLGPANVINRRVLEQVKPKRHRPVRLTWDRIWRAGRADNLGQGDECPGVHESRPRRHVQGESRKDFGLSQRS